MMRFVASCLILVLLATCPCIYTSAAAAKNIRGAISPSPTTLKCRITRLDTLLEQHGDNGIMVANYQETICIPIVNEIESFMLQSVTLPNEIYERHESEIKAGRLVVRIENGIVLEENGILLPVDSSVVVLQEENSPETSRWLAHQRNHRTVAVVRVSLSSGVQVGYTANEIHEHLFENDNCMAQQFYNCLNGKMHLEYVGTYEITVAGKPADFTSPAQIRNQALAILTETFGSPADLADHVMVILPPCGFSFVANAVSNHWLSTYNDLWSLDMTVYMHEIGHNLGLGHAFLSGGGYDFSSVMSATGYAPNLSGPLKCFNAADNKKLGFFNDRLFVVDTQADPIQFVTVAAFPEWAKSYKEDPILVSFGMYSMQYNLASGHNRGTETLRDMLTIAHLDHQTGKTTVNSNGLAPDGAIFTVNNFAGTGKTLQVEACKQVNGDSTYPNNMIVGFTLGETVSPCSLFMAHPTSTATTTIATTPVTTTAATTTTTTTAATTTTTTTKATTSSASSPLSAPVCRNTSMFDAMFWWGNAYVVRSCDFVGKYPNFCVRKEISNPDISRFVFDVCEQECATWTGCQISEAAEPLSKPLQPTCPDTSNVKIVVWMHGKGKVRKTCSWVEEFPGYCRRREYSGDPLRFYVYQYCEQECSEFVWCDRV